LSGKMKSHRKAGVDEEWISALRAAHVPGLVKEPSNDADDRNGSQIKSVETPGATRVRQEFDNPPKREEPNKNHYSEPNLADARERGLRIGSGHGRRPQTPRASGAQMCLCIWSCIRTGRRSSRIHPASSAGSSRPNTQLISTALTRGARLSRRSTSRAHS
jgi:hypothetical protein